MQAVDRNIRVTCPTRIDFTGGFTDVLPFRAHQPVCHVNLAINLLVEVKLKQRDDSIIFIEDKRTKTICRASSTNVIDEKFTLVRTALEKFSVKNGVSVAIDSQAPVGAGLGTSGALSVALAAALVKFTDQVPLKNPLALATLAAGIERDSKTLAGMQDQFVAAFGGLNVFRFFKSEFTNTKMPLTDRTKTDLSQHLRIVYRGGRRRSTDIVTDVMSAYMSGDVAVIKALLKLNTIAPEIAQAVQSANWDKLSSLLHYVCKQQLQLSPKLVDAGNEKILHDLQIRNIQGVKLLGGGGVGACMLVVCPQVSAGLEVARVAQDNNAVLLPVQCATDGALLEVY